MWAHCPAKHTQTNTHLHFDLGPGVQHVLDHAPHDPEAGRGIDDDGLPHQFRVVGLRELAVWRGVEGWAGMSAWRTSACSKCFLLPASLWIVKAGTRPHLNATSPLGGRFHLTWSMLSTFCTMALKSEVRVLTPTPGGGWHAGRWGHGGPRTTQGCAPHSGNAVATPPL